MAVNLVIDDSLNTKGQFVKDPQSNASKLALTKDGNVGIGEINPTHPLEVIANGGNGIAIKDPEESSTSLNLQNNQGFWHFSGPRSYEKNNPLSIFWNTGGNYSRYLTILDDGKVGVGVDSPIAEFQVNGSLVLSADNARLRLMRNNPNYIDFQKDNPLHFRGMDINDGGEQIRMTISKEGRVGIGTETPTSSLEIQGDGIRLKDPATSATALNLENTNGSWQISGPRSFETDNNLSIFWSKDGTNTRHLSLMDDGKIGIGVDSPTAKLQISGDLLLSEDKARLRLMNPNTNTIDFEKNNPLQFRSTDSNDTDPQVRLSIMNDGKVGIGTTEPKAALEVITGENIGLILNSATNKTASLNLQNNIGAWHISGPRSSENKNPLSIFWFYQGSYKRYLTLLEDGKFGIGVDAPENPLEVKGTTKTDDLIINTVPLVSDAPDVNRLASLFIDPETGKLYRL